LAYEGLNNVVTENSNAIVIVNDNDQSISKNPTGGIYTALRKLRESNGQAEDNFFTALEYEYHYLADGNDLDQLIALFKSVKDTDHPVLLHVQTEKGHGFAPAEANHEKFHAGGPIDLKTGDYKGAGQPAGETYDAVLSDLVFNKLKQDRSVIALSSGTPMIIFNQEQRQADTTDYGDLNKNQVVHQGSKVAIFGVGNLLGLAKQAAAKLAEEGVDATVINPRYLTGLDTELLDQLQADHQVVVTLEDGILEGGYGQTIASYLGDSAVRVQNYGLQRAYPDRYDVNELLAQNGLTADKIAQQALKALN
ncbi:transketolase C-terminal domain-containing protein, partial [Limosilactobacillus fermentum]|uniref:transketolase C-terminal domain-containing protein n=1 Tax=Limosilactobacillus fermentum TaxID=1613 RepID=UPI0021CAEA4D